MKLSEWFSQKNKNHYSCWLHLSPSDKCDITVDNAATNNIDEKGDLGRKKTNL